MEEAKKRDPRIDRIASEVLRLSRSTLLVHLRFLDSALSRLALIPDGDGGVATDGVAIHYDPKHVLRTYCGEQERITRDYLHLLLHCTFRHMFFDPSIDRDCWDLAADIAVECAIDSLALSCVHAGRQEPQQQNVQRLMQDGVLLTAEKLYRYFRNHELPAETLKALREPFYADDHSLWYKAMGDGGGEEETEDSEPSDEPDENGNEAPRESGEESAKPGGGEEPGTEDKTPPKPEEEQTPPETGKNDATGEESPSEDEGRQEESEGERGDEAPQPSDRRGKPEESEDPGDPLRDGEEGMPDARFDGSDGEAQADVGTKQEQKASGKSTPVSRSELKEQWSEVARRIKVDMETTPKTRGDRAGAMLQNLKAVTREAYDYSDFLRRFAVLGETVQINDDEFDYIFYTYGLELYGRMPLIEPLEYKEVKRIREFVIAIDTSGSVKGDEVQRFIQKTYNILMEQESFFTKINLHIIQCDAAIQEVKKIETHEAFDEYLASMTLKGFGGTDFRPVFAYVARMLAEKEFVNLKGMIYFTDGQGVYPAEKPPYDAAFVFVRDDYEVPKVPVWAIRLTLDPNEL